MEYSTSLAANTPGYEISDTTEGPLALLDPLAHNFTPVAIATIGAESNGENGKIYRICLYNNGSETVTIESLVFPDDRFEVDWNGITEYKPKLMSSFSLLTKEAVERDDYRFILTYRGGKYPPQTFHINLHPDINKLIVERNNGN